MNPQPANTYPPQANKGKTATAVSPTNAQGVPNKKRQMTAKNGVYHPHKGSAHFFDSLLTNGKSDTSSNGWSASDSSSCGKQPKVQSSSDSISNSNSSSSFYTDEQSRIAKTRMRHHRRIQKRNKAHNKAYYPQ